MHGIAYPLGHKEDNALDVDFIGSHAQWSSSVASIAIETACRDPSFVHFGDSLDACDFGETMTDIWTLEKDTVSP